MNDIGTIEKLIYELNKNISSHQRFILTIAVFTGINLILGIINIIVQYKLKNKEKSINAYNLRESKRIECQEISYGMLEELTYYDMHSSSQNEFIQKVKDINVFISKNKLYLSKSIVNTSQEFTDYFLSVLTHYNNKDYRKELDILGKFISKFNNGQ